MNTYQGSVNGLDTQATKGLLPRCQIFINQSPQDYIQVTTAEHSLQTALELACIKDVLVEVSYYEESGVNVLTRVRLLDR